MFLDTFLLFIFLCQTNQSSDVSNFQSITVIMDTEFVLEGWWKSSRIWWWWWLCSLCVTKFYGMSQNFGSLGKMNGLFSNWLKISPRELWFLSYPWVVWLIFSKAVMTFWRAIYLFIVMIDIMNSMLIGILSVWFCSIPSV